MVNNTTDRTLDVCKPYEGEHVRVVMGEEFRCVINLIDTGRVPDKKVGALNAGYEYAKAHGADYMLGCDGDTSAPRGDRPVARRDRVRPAYRGREC